MSIDSILDTSHPTFMRCACAILKNNLENSGSYEARNIIHVYNIHCIYIYLCLIMFHIIYIRVTAYMQDFVFPHLIRTVVTEYKIILFYLSMKYFKKCRFFSFFFFCDFKIENPKIVHQTIKILK